MEGAGPGRPGVAGKLGELLNTIKAGGWCEQQSSLMRAFAFGVLDPAGERHALAVAHCRECPACRAHVASLRGLASVLPLPLLPPPTAGGSMSSRRAAIRGAGPKRRLAVNASRLGGSLTAKLAITAAVMLGVGYSLLGGRAHGSTPTHQTAARPLGVGRPRSHPPRTPNRVQHLHIRRSVRRASRARVDSTSNMRSSGTVSGYEFAPERVAGPAAPARAPAPTHAGAGEFGFE
jgi:hypothetical protein